MAVSPPAAVLGIKAPDFTLPGTDGMTHRLADLRGKKGTVVVFICNHCPYVKGVIGRLVADARLLMAEGVNFVAINSNDAEAYPEDSFDHMKVFARTHSFPFPYLYDESQEIARAYEAVCTPDYFGLNAAGEVQYRGRLDEGRKDPPPAGVKRELLDAMRIVAATGRGPKDQIPSIGCSMKWREMA